MTMRTLLVLALATICGLLAVAGVTQVLQLSGSGSRAEMVPVVTATKDVRRGSVLSASVLKVRQYPKESVPSGAISSLDDVIDRCVMVALVEDDLVLKGKLAPKGKGPGLQWLIPVGWRAVTIRTSNVSAGVGGFILPGNKVDVLTTSGGGRGAKDGGVTRTLLQNVEVLAVDQRLDAPDSSKVDPKEVKSVTLLVTPRQAEKLVNRGLLHLSLRNSGDGAASAAAMARSRPSQKSSRQPTPGTGTAGSVVAATFDLPLDTPDSAEPSDPRYGEIRTIRGNNQGNIRIQF
jgi:pilus assembly protein CpaB